MLTLDKLTLTVGGLPHLHEVTLTLQPGRIYSVLGRTNAGKTTLLRAIAGLIGTDSGSVSLDGHDLNSVPPWRRDIAMVYQQFINYPQLTVLDNVLFPLRRKKIDKQQALRRATEALATVGLADFHQRKPAQLSGGQQQRVAIARSLARQCRILLLDEPLVNLDYKLREQLREEFRGLIDQEGSGGIVLYTTTEPVEALMLGDEVIVLHEGRVLQVGAPAEIYDRPATSEVAEVVNDPPMNIVTGSLSGETITLGSVGRVATPAHFAGLPDGDYQFGIRAGDLRRDAAGVSGEVTFVEISGSETFAHLDVSGTELVLRAEGIQDVAIDTRLTFAVDAERLFAFSTAGQLRAAPVTDTEGIGHGAS